MEILGKLCFARLKLNLKTEDRFKLKTKLGFAFYQICKLVETWRRLAKSSTNLAKKHANLICVDTLIKSISIRESESDVIVL